MGFLDEVKRRQATERARSEPGDRLLDPHSNPHWTRLQPKLGLLKEALRVFCRRLDVAQPNVWVSYALRDYGELRALRQIRYQTRVDERTEAVTLELTCVGTERLEFELGSREAADEALSFLLGNGLKCQYRSQADWRFKFTVQPEVPVKLDFELHACDPVLKLRTQNLPRIGQKLERIAPEMIGEEFIAELEKCILREDNRFNELCGNVLPEHLRARLQSQVEARKTTRHFELNESDPRDPGRPNRLMGLLGRLSRPGRR